MTKVAAFFVLLLALSTGGAAGADTFWPFPPSALATYSAGRWSEKQLAKEKCQEPSPLGVDVCDYRFFEVATVSAYSRPGLGRTQTLTLVCGMDVCDLPTFERLAAEIVGAFNFAPMGESRSMVSEIMNKKTLVYDEGGYAFFTTGKKQYRLDAFWKP